MTSPPTTTFVCTQEHWVHESGRPVQRAEMMQVLQSLEAVLIQTVYNAKMASVGLSDIAMDTTVTYTTSHGRAHSVEECRCLTQQEPPTTIGKKQQGLTVPAATVSILSPQMPHWLFWLVLREL